MNPVTLAEAKKHLRVDFSDDDAYIEALIGVCSEHVETVTSRVLIEREIAVRATFPQGAGLSAMVAIELVPLTAVESVEYVDPAGQTVTLDPALYRVETGEHGMIYPADGGSWPRVKADAFKPVTITVRAGYAPTQDSPPDPAGNVPQALKQAILLLVGHMYENREPVVVGMSVASLPLTFDALTYPYRVRLGF